MKHLVVYGVLVIGLAACENSSKPATKADSLRVKLDTTLNKLGDSIEAKGERTLDTLKAKFDAVRNRKDTVRDSAR